MTTLTQARNLFPGVKECIYFENSARGLLPLTARDAAMGYYDARLMGAAKESHDIFNSAEDARVNFADLIKADADEITLTRNVTEGLNIVVSALPWKAGNSAIVSKDVEHPNGIYSLINIRDKYGIEVRTVNAGDDLSISVQSIGDAIDETTRLVIVSSVTFSTGARTDLAALGRLCQAKGVTLLVDGAQSVGALDIDVKALSIDAMAVGSSKYLCGPYGLGFLYVRRELAESLRPTYLGRYSVDLGKAHEGEYGGSSYQLMPSARRFDLGSYNYGSAAAVNASLKLLKDVSIPVIEQHVLELAKIFDAGLRALGVPVLSGGNAQHRSHLVLVGQNPPTPASEKMIAALAQFLEDRNIRASQRLGRIRFSFHFYNTLDEVQSTLNTIQSFIKEYY